MSKGLDALKEIVDYVIVNFTNNETKYQQDLQIIEKALKEYEQYKEIEDKLGINLITLSEALKNGIYDKVNGNWYYFGMHELYLDCCFNIHNMKNGKTYYFNDCGVTWAIVKEKLK